jgi:hypothetical protein
MKMKIRPKQQHTGDVIWLSKYSYIHPLLVFGGEKPQGIRESLTTQFLNAEWWFRN